MSDALVTLKDSALRLAIPLEKEHEPRVNALIQDSEELVQDAFAEVGRDYCLEVANPLQRRAIIRVIREMVATAVIVGPYSGARSVNSSSGPTSDGLTWDKVPEVSFAGVKLTDAHRRALGLVVGNDFAPSWNFPPATRWPLRGGDH